MSRRLAWWLVLLLVWSASAIYGGMLLKRGWVPHDEGTIGQSAERALEGELPHRDFDEVYTGGLTYLNAAAMAVFGRTMAVPRFVLLAVFLAWIPAVYGIACRFVSHGAAGSVTLLAVAFSIPNYSAAIPSWYNLFLATFGTAAVLRYLGTGRSRWLAVAGFCGGISFLFKLSGLYFIAGVLLFLVFREQGPAQKPARPNFYSLFVMTSLALFVAAVFLTVRHTGTFVAYVEFAFPAAALAAFLGWREWRISPRPASERLCNLMTMVGPFLVGATVPVLIFLAPYFASGTLGSFVNDVFIAPARRFQFASMPPSGFSPNKLLGCLLLGIWLVTAYLGLGRSWLVRVGAAGGLTAVLVLSASHAKVLSAAWAPLALLVAFTVLATVAVIGFSNARISFERQQEVVLLVAVAAVCTLVQVPFSAPIYFCYAAPLLVLAVVAWFSTRPHGSQFLLGALLLFYLTFLIFRITPSFLDAMGDHYQPDRGVARLTLPRSGSLRVEPWEAQEYDELIPLVQQHAGASPFIYAAPDCPEVYFLAGKQNPTRSIFDFLEDPQGRTARVLQAIEGHQVKVVAILTDPEFSSPMADDLQSALEERFPESAMVGRFEVRWRP